MNRTTVIKNFLVNCTHHDLASLYTHDMECQVNVGQDGGEKISGEYKGRKWIGWTDNLTVWKSFRIPFHSNTEPYYNDSELKFDFEKHVEAIGMTGWDWVAKKSRWVAFDFDAIVGHSDRHTKKLTSTELEEVKNKAKEIPWVTIRKSTSGKGLHIYVHIDSDVVISNHNEHAAVARSILGNMSAITGYDFSSKVDICGGNMWVWHRKMRDTDGLTVIKQGEPLTEIPYNWKDHIKVIKGHAKRTLPQDISDISVFEQISGQYPKVPLDSQHLELINYLRESEAFWWWDQDNHMLVCHTYDLKSAHTDLNMRGFFETSTSRSSTHNCFAFPLRRGAWAVRRFTPGVREHDSWDQDGSGWTRCFYNREPDLRTAARAFGGVEDTKGGFVFREADVAARAAELLGVYLEYDPQLGSRETTLKEHKDGRLIVEIIKTDHDRTNEMTGWLTRGNKPWTRIFNVQTADPTETEIGSFDDLIRHVITTTDDDAGWMIKTDEKWRREPWNHIKVALASLGYNNKDITKILGSSIFKCWTLVNKPFQPEYIGDRQWNKESAQLKYLPLPETDNLKYNSWNKILHHIGLGLDDAIKENPWCRLNGIDNGADYLKCWIASIFQFPEQPLPYLFLYSKEQRTGKSILHEALSMLLTNGYQRADYALTNQSGFNAELRDAIICVVEEVSMDKNVIALNRIKDWVTATEINIHTKGKTPYHITNTTHWIQCANDHKACPIFPGDTRITMITVPEIDPIEMIPKKQLLDQLEKEAQHFLTAMLALELPESNDRLNVPVIDTYDKSLVMAGNKSIIELFLSQICVYAPGYMVKYSDIFNRFLSWVGPQKSIEWSKIRFGRELPPIYPKGRNPKDAQHYIGNIAFSTKDLIIKPQPVLKLQEDGYLRNDE
jgi:hypothetical protein